MEIHPLSTSPRNADYRARCLAKPFFVYCTAKRSECKRKGFDYDLDPEYIESLWTGVCPVFGTELALPLTKVGYGSDGTQTAHLDRRDPDKGYTKGNVCWISGRANRIKYNATLKELQALVAWMQLDFGDTNEQAIEVYRNYPSR